MATRKLTGLRPQAYEHPLDTKALDALTRTAGLDTLVTKLNAWGADRILRMQLTGSYFRVTPDSFPEVYSLFITARDRLDLPIMPEMYIVGSREINAFTSCVERPLIALTSGAIDLLTPDELIFVIAHEMGHIKSGHVLYCQIADVILPVAGELVDSIPFMGLLVRTGLGGALLHWKRMSEYTADRAGLLACQNMHTALRTMTKLAGLPRKYFDSHNTEDFVQQARDFRALEAEPGSMIAKFLATVGATHPWTVERAQQLLEWFDRGEYQATLDDPRRRALPSPNTAAACRGCGKPLRPGERFCIYCGRPIA